MLLRLTLQSWWLLPPVGTHCKIRPGEISTQYSRQVSREQALSNKGGYTAI